MSSRSSSPLPPLEHKPPEQTSSSLSNDALYAPLSNYDATKSNTHQKNRHSLTIQTSSSLRESSLIAFLTSTCRNLKTSHPYECSLYRGIGGSISKHGMGDNDNANSVTKSSIESKLSNRGLVLVGGGIHSHASRTSDEYGVKSNLTTIASASTRKRDRKRVGGNGMFGSLSRRKRNKILRGKLTLPCQQSISNPNLDRECTGDGVAIKRDEEHAPLENTCRSSPTTIHRKEDFSSIVENLHSMWMDYMSQLLLQINPQIQISGKPRSLKNDEASIHDSPLTPQLRKQLTSLLIDAEHVGMSAKIIQCPSRRHLVQHRCVVVNETMNTWRVAMTNMNKKCNKNREAPTASLSANNTIAERSESQSPSRSWEIVMIPKHGTVLDVNVPLYEDSSCKLPFQSQKTSVIRLET
ncbi:hypothetical protein HJC23_013856 [Cyclotella cryptica]|uniref:Uncharacterized protein n=1 Tax=Cyclotella cryptica TaxID=29204 RepID=A0ABD3PCC2_9STRA|eukprot:CCRYP_016317-RA/>CCRYP_016317-RA protein AED:0.02 eAED:0.02 QI:425/1/1/1/0/0/2/90/409